ncbi:MAG: hypothetical protein M5R36_12875 [Deltaproteobacteria bacterium]|nr:hypothetical protein [Deltaproteobacteria bacterium]
MQELRRYSRWIHYGERRLVLFDEHFSTGDLDGATDALKNAWRALLMPPHVSDRLF